jgi:hypothetical protein
MGKKTIRTLLKNDKDASGLMTAIENVSFPNKTLMIIE